MATIAEVKPLGPRPPTQASVGRRVFHLLVALAGWVLFVWWWIIVLWRVDHHQVRITGIFVGVTLLVCVVLTTVWTYHNLRIWRHRGPRTQVRESQEDYARDRLGRSVAFKGDEHQLKNDPVIVVRMEHEGKVYRPSSAPQSRAEPSPWLPANNGYRVRR
jgi:hypothetical protein